MSRVNNYELRNGWRHRRHFSYNYSVLAVHACPVVFPCMHCLVFPGFCMKLVLTTKSMLCSRSLFWYRTFGRMQHKLQFVWKYELSNEFKVAVTRSARTAYAIMLLSQTTKRQFGIKCDRKQIK